VAVNRRGRGGLVGVGSGSESRAAAHGSPPEVRAYGHLNLIEGVWRRLKGSLMPRRFYDSVAELKAAVLHALRLLGAVEVQCSLGGT
jgi:hypothetical protein